MICRMNISLLLSSAFNAIENIYHLLQDILLVFDGLLQEVANFSQILYSCFVLPLLVFL